MITHPRDIIRQVGVSEGSVVGDFGTGSGAHALVLSELVGEHGSVYAFDVQKDLVTRLLKEAKDANIANLHPIWADLEISRGTKLADEALDLAIVANTLFQIENKEVFLAEVFRVTRANGRLLLVDWSDAKDGLGPRAAHIVTQPSAREKAERAGFIFDRELGVGEHHYALIFRKKL